MYLNVDGSKVFFSTGSGSGNAGQPAVVFIHGAGQDHSVFVLASRHFARKGYRVCALDLPGHGRSQGPALTSIEAMADWLARFLDAAGIEQAAIVGHSMGSLVALQLAASCPDRVRALVLAGTSLPMPVADPLLEAARSNDHSAIDMANSWSHSRRALLGGNTNPGISMVMSGQRLLEQAGEDVFFTDLNACNGVRDGLELASRVQARTLVLMGEKDRMTAPVSARDVAGAIPDCRQQTLPGCGHAMFSEQPNAVLDALITIV